jgi:hypothetical protein
MTTELINEAMQWVEADPDPQTQRELLEMISHAETEEGESPAARALLRTTPVRDRGVARGTRCGTLCA